MKKWFCILIGTFLLIACVYSRNKSPNTYLENLNGENSDSSVGLSGPVGVTVVDARPVQRRISGKIYCGDGISEVPASKAEIELKKGTETIAQGGWKEKGIFLILASLEEKKAYTVHVKAFCGQATRPLPVGLNKDLTDFDFHIH